VSEFESVPPPRLPSPPQTPRRSRFTVPPERRADVAATALALGASGAAYGIADPFTRAGALLACSVALYLMGLFQRKPGT
jgi:hypothetical protein